MRRREFIRLLGGAAAVWPLTALAQQQPTMPVIGYLNGASAIQAGFHKGLSETGYSEGQSVAFEYRYADGEYDRLPALAADLVNRRVSVIVATAGTPTIRAAKAATSSIPIVFVIGGDPVTFGIVASLNRPGGNITGMTLSGSETVAKRLGLMLELVPAARQLLVLNASTESDFAAVSTDIDQHHVDALFVAADPFFDDRRKQIVSLAAGHRYQRVIPGATLWWMADC
jgi:putative ABC transport system substrate-binding protein